MPIAILLKIISNLGSLSGVLKDFEQDAKDLFAGKMSKDEALGLLADLEKIIAMGFISIPGVDMGSLSNTISGGEKIVDDMLAAVSDVKSQGVAAIVPDLGKAVDDLTSALTAGVVGLKDSTKEQVLQVLAEIKAGL
jgi:hypothetical protein